MVQNGTCKMTPQQIRAVLTTLDCCAKLDGMKTHKLQSQLNTNNHEIRFIIRRQKLRFCCYVNQADCNFRHKCSQMTI